MWANAQRDGRPAEYRRRPLFMQRRKVWLTPTTECRAVTLPRRETRYTVHRSNSSGSSPNFGQKTRGYVQRWRLLYKTSDISEMKQSRAKVTTECL